MSFFNHDTSIVEGKDIADGTKIWHFAHVRETAKIGRNCNIGKGAYIDSDVIIGDNCKIQNFVNVYKGVTIENDVFVGPSATFTNDLYPRAFQWSDDDLVNTLVKKGASIGANSTIVCGITIGQYAMIAAGSIVTKDVPDHGLMIGTPAKLSGHICYCGRRLSDKIDEDVKKIVFQCNHCSKKVEIHK